MKQDIDMDPHEIYQERMTSFLKAIKKYQTTNVSQINQKADKQEKQQLGKIRNDASRRNEQEFKKMEDSIKVAEKIFKSRKINQCRMSEMKVRFDMIQKIQEQTKKNLKKIVEDPTKYKNLLKTLIMQGLIKLVEETVELRCLKAEEKLVSEVVAQCQKQFNEISQVQTKIEIDKKNYLNDDDLGGIVLTSFKGRIVCDNTLKSRLNYCVQMLLPDIRKLLFQASDNELNRHRQQKKARELQQRKQARQRELELAKAKEMMGDKQNQSAKIHGKA